MIASRAVGPLVAVVLLAPAAVDAQPDTSAVVQQAEPAHGVTLTYSNRAITTLRARIVGRLPAERAEAVKRILDELASARTIAPVTSRVENGVAIVTVAGRDVFALLPTDLDQLAGETLDAAGKAAAANLQLALEEAVEARTPREIAIGILAAVAVTILFVSLLWALQRLRRRIEISLAETAERQLKHLPGGSSVVLTRDRLRGAVHHVATAGMLALDVLLAYWWLQFVLRRFPYTRPLGEALREFLLTQISAVGVRIVQAMPGLFTVMLIFLLARLAVKISNSFFDAVATGRIGAPQAYVDTAVPSKRLIATLIWVFALIGAYPYLPGSGTEAFKGISVFLGLVVSLGSTGIVNQIISSFTLTYSRALRVGDFVRIGDVEGTVTQLGVLSTKIKTLRREEVTIPNAVVVADRTTNYSRFAQQEGVYVSTSVTIGYDAPWRQVQALLLMAAARTPGIRKDPRPVVLQTALEDFYVRYTLLVSLERADQRAAVLNELHANIQDAFNEFGVQIMSPNYEADPDRPKTVPKDRWYKAPARVRDEQAMGT